MNIQHDSSDDETLPDEFQRDAVSDIDHNFFNDSISDMHPNVQLIHSVPRMNNSRESLRLTQRILQGIWLTILGVGKCCCGCLRYLGNNKFACFMFFQMIFVFLRLAGTNPQLIFWLTFILTLTILFLCLCHFCIATHRTRDESETNMIRRRGSDSNEFNDQLMQQLVLHALRQRLEALMIDQRARLARVNLMTQGQAQRFRLPPFDLMREIIIEIGMLEEQAQNNRNRGLSEEQINELPHEVYHKNINQESEACSICIDEFEQDQTLRKLPCGHRFHIKCIDEWLKISNSCPNCKAEIPRTNLTTGPQQINLIHHHYMEEP